MNIKTRFNVGDNILYINKGTIVSGVIIATNISIYNNISVPEILYKIKDFPYTIEEHSIFKNAKDMYKQLKSKFPINEKHENN